MLVYYIYIIYYVCCLIRSPPSQFLFIVTFAIFGMSIYQKSYNRFCVNIHEIVPNCIGDPSRNFAAQCNISQWKTAPDALISWPVGSDQSLAVQGGYPFVDSCKIFDTEGASSLVVNFDLYPKDIYGRYACDLIIYIYK